MPTISPRDLSAITTSAVAATPKQATPMPDKQASPVDTSVQQQGVEEKKPETAKSDDLSAKIALAKREKAIREMQKRYEADRQKFEAEKEEIRRSARAEMLGTIQKDPFKVIGEAGLTPEQLTNFMLNQPKPEEQRIMALQEEIRALKLAQEENMSQAKKAETERYQEARKNVRVQLERLVDGNDQFENIKADEAFDAVIDLMELTYKEEGYLMKPEEAALKVEQHLIDSYYERSQRKSVLSRLQKVAPPSQGEAQQKNPTSQQQNSPLTTLSNRNAVSSSSRLTPEERRQRAIMRAQGLDPDATGKLA